jgi:hypothetical protein
MIRQLVERSRQEATETFTNALGDAQRVMTQEEVNEILLRIAVFQLALNKTLEESLDLADIYARIAKSKTDDGKWKVSRIKYNVGNYSESSDKTIETDRDLWDICAANRSSKSYFKDYYPIDIDDEYDDDVFQNNVTELMSYFDGALIELNSGVNDTQDAQDATTEDTTTEEVVEDDNDTQDALNVSLGDFLSLLLSRGNSTGTPHIVINIDTVNIDAK